MFGQKTTGGTLPPISAQNVDTGKPASYSRPCYAQTTQKSIPTQWQGAHSLSRACAPTFAEKRTRFGAEQPCGAQGRRRLPPFCPAMGVSIPIKTTEFILYPILFHDAPYNVQSVPAFDHYRPSETAVQPTARHESEWPKQNLQRKFPPFLRPVDSRPLPSVTSTPNKGDSCQVIDTPHHR